MNEEIVIYQKDYKDCLQYIEKFWEKITFEHKTDKMIHLGLPNKYVAPSTGIFGRDQFYWDSYFVITGLVRCGREELAKGMVDNFIYLFERFNIIPMRNRYYNVGISQIPFLTSMALEVFQVTGNVRWLTKIIATAEKELKQYWMNKDLTEKHLVHKGLSRYCDHYITHLGAEHETGWDMTSRFNNHCLDFLPIDLNCCLYKYEQDIAHIYSRLKKNEKATSYLLDAEKRKKKINQLMWNEKAGFFFDYNYQKKEQSKFLSVAGFYPLWSGLASQEQAERLRNNLHLFEYAGGLANTQSKGLSEEVKQHDYPNGWPQQQWIVIKGLMNYGFKEDAIRLAKKWLDLNKKIFNKTGKFWEKYDVVTGKVGGFNTDRYPTESGFGWTNAIFLRLISDLATE